MYLLAKTDSSTSHLQKLLALNIKNARKRLGISQMEPAKRADISAGHMNDIEACRRWVSASTFAIIADQLHALPYQLLREGKEKPQDMNSLLTEILAKLRKGVNSKIERIIVGYLPGSKKRHSR